MFTYECLKIGIYFLYEAKQDVSEKYIIKLLMFRQCRTTVYFIFPLLLIILGFIFHWGRNIHFISRMTRFCILFTASVFIPFYEEMKGIYRLNILIKIFGSEHGFLLVKRSFLLVKRFSSTQSKMEIYYYFLCMQLPTTLCQLNHDVFSRVGSNV